MTLQQAERAERVLTRFGGKPTTLIATRLGGGAVPVSVRSAVRASNGVGGAHRGCVLGHYPPPRPCCTDRSLGGEDWTVYQGPVSDPGQPPCHSKRTKIAVITSRSSGTE